MSSIDEADLKLRKIFVVGFNKTNTEDELLSFFSKYGSIKEVFIKKDNNGVSKCYGFITFETVKGCFNSLVEPDKVFENRNLHCKLSSKSLSKEDKSESNSHNSNSNAELEIALNKIYVKGIPQSLSDESFRSFFSRFGDLKSCNLMRDKETGNARGFGFVTYKSKVSAMKCLEESSKVIEGVLVHTNLAGRDHPIFGGLKGFEEELRKVFVRGLSHDTTDHLLGEYMTQFGEVENCFCAKQNGRNAGYGFCLFKLASSAMKSLEKRDNELLRKKIFMQLAVIGKKRKREIDQQHHQQQQQPIVSSRNINAPPGFEYQPPVVHYAIEATPEQNLEGFQASQFYQYHK